VTHFLLLGASFGTGNMGVGALTAGALKIVAQRYPQARVSLLDYGREPVVSIVEVNGRSVEVPLVNLRFSWKVLLANNVAALLAMACLSRLVPGLRQTLLRRNRWLRTVAQADAALAVSGGDSFSDIYGLGRFFYVALPQLLALALGVKLIMLPQTIGPFQGTPARRMARFLVRRAASVYSRDKAGVGEIHALLGSDAAPDKARFCYDMGFVLEPHAPKQASAVGAGLQRGATSRPLVGLNVSGLLLIGGYTKSNMFKLRLNYGDLVDALIAELIDRKGADVLLTPHVFGEDEESDTTAARIVHERLAQRYGRHLFVVRGAHDQSEIKHVIGSCDFFVGSRMHACVAALSQGIPAVGIAYSDKFAGVFESIGAGAMVADPRQLTLAQTVHAVGAAFDDRARTRAQLVRRMPDIKSRILQLLDGIE
jgi:colanic acid/amylovoran biosynthesis protein